MQESILRRTKTHKFRRIDVDSLKDIVIFIGEYSKVYFYHGSLNIARDNCRIHRIDCNTDIHTTHVCARRRATTHAYGTCADVRRHAHVPYRLACIVSSKRMRWTAPAKEHGKKGKKENSRVKLNNYRSMQV
jgi:hypothetical protein